jgi:hypothetical protein
MQQKFYIQKQIANADYVNYLPGQQTALQQQAQYWQNNNA